MVKQRVNRYLRLVTEYRICPIMDWGVPGWKRVI